MSQVYISNNQNFFKSFHADILQKLHPGDDNLLVYNHWSHSFFLESKQEHFLWRLFASIVLGNNYNLDEHAILLHELASRKISPMQHTNANELIATTKTIHLLQKLYRHVIARRKGIRENHAILSFFYLYNKSLMKKALNQAGENMEISPLTLACLNQLSGLCVSYICEDGIQANGVYTYDFLVTALCKKKRFQLSLDLIEKGAAIPESKITCGSLLVEALKANTSRKIILKLIQKGADITVTDGEGKTALHLACKEHQNDIVQLLLQNGAAVNVQDKNQNTPLHIACTTANESIVHLLLSYNADPTTVNFINKTPLQCLCESSANPFLTKNASAIFYHFFKDFGAIEIFQESGIGTFIEKVGRNPHIITHNTKNSPFVNPLLLPLLLNDKQLAIQCAKILGVKRYFGFVDSLEDSYPHFSSIEFLVTSLVTLDSSHIKKGFTTEPIPTPPSYITLDTLLEFFQEINFYDRNKEDFIDPKTLPNDTSRTITPKLLYEALNKLVYDIKNKISFIGTATAGSQALDKFYEIIGNALKNIILKLQTLQNRGERKNLLISVLSELAFATFHCGGRYFQTAVNLYHKVCKNKVFSFEERVYQNLAEYREICLSSLILNSSHNVNKYNKIMYQHGIKLGIPGAHLYQQYNDPFGDMDSEIPKEFFKVYNSKAIQTAWILQLLKTEGDFRENFLDWHKSNIPKEWRKEEFDEIQKTIQEKIHLNSSREEIAAYLLSKEIVLGPLSYEEAIQSEKVNSYLEAKVYTQHNTLRITAITTLLLKLRVFSLLPEIDNYETSVDSELCWWHGVVSVIEQFLT